MNNQIDVGRVVRDVFELYRDQAGVLLPAAIVVFGLEGLLRGLLVAISPILIVVAVIVQVMARYLYQGMVVELVADVQDGRRDSSAGDLFRSVTPVLLPLIVAGTLAGLGIGIGLVLLIVPGLFLLTIWAVVSPVIVLERPGVIAAFERSRELVRGNGWQVLGVIAIFFLILLVVGAVLGAIGGALGPAGNIVAGIVSSVIAAPLVALAGAVLYFNLRRARGDTSAGAAGMGAPGDQRGGVALGSPGAGGESPAPPGEAVQTQQPSSERPEDADGPGGGRPT